MPVPRRPFRPIAPEQRIHSLDVLRGFAVLGILVMNIQSFAMPEAASIMPVAYGKLDGLDYWVWYLSDLFAHRKFMGLFSLLFGAGMLLMRDRARAARREWAGLHFRRMGVLAVIGAIHAFLFWDGDILLSYALCACLLYPFLRLRLRPKALLITGLAFLAVGSLISLLSGIAAPLWSPADLAEFRSRLQPTGEALAEEIAAMRGSWGGEIAQRAPRVLKNLMILPYQTLWRACGFMLLGMALIKWRVLAGERSRRLYTMLFALGALLGLPLSVLGAWSAIGSSWEPIHSYFLASQYGYWGALPMTLGYLSLIMLILRAGLFQRVMNRLAAVGRLALSNYLLQTVICTTLFYGRGFGLFGELERTEQAMIVLGIWLIQLSLSPLWLAYFRFGPVEWLWRSLAYRKRQAFRIS